MGSHRPPRRLVLFSALTLAAGAALSWMSGWPSSASAAEPRRASSVCEAHELKALKAVQEQQRLIEKQQQQIDALTKTLQTLSVNQ